MTIHRAVTLALALIALVAWVVYLVKFPRQWGYAIGIMVWLLNIIIFIVSLIIATEMGPIDTLFFNGWSTIIRWQAIVYAIGGACCLLLIKHKRQAKDE